MTLSWSFLWRQYLRCLVEYVCYSEYCLFLMSGEYVCHRHGTNMYVIDMVLIITRWTNYLCNIYILVHTCTSYIWTVLFSFFNTISFPHFSLHVWKPLLTIVCCFAITIFLLPSILFSNYSPPFLSGVIEICDGLDWGV